MFKHSKTLLLATLLAPGVALAQINIGDELGATETAIRAALEAQGYTTTEIEVEDDEIEVAASSAGRFFEIEVSPETGLVRAVEEEIDDDGDEDEDDSDDDH
ncbi:MAG: PepSY domain-containing protein [Paracoccaceae bacterium]